MVAINYYIVTNPGQSILNDKDHDMNMTKYQLPKSNFSLVLLIVL